MQGPILWQTLECYKKLWDLMAEKKYTDEYGATTATSLRQKAAYHGTGRVIISDSYFRSLKAAANALMKCGLYSKALHKGFPRKLLNNWSFEERMGSL